MLFTRYKANFFVNNFPAQQFRVLHDHLNAIIFILNIDLSEKIAPCLGPYKAYLPIIFSFHN